MLVKRGDEISIPDSDEIDGMPIFEGDPEDAFMTLEAGVYTGIWEWMQGLHIQTTPIILVVTEDESFAVSSTAV